MPRVVPGILDPHADDYDDPAPDAYAPAESQWLKPDPEWNATAATYPRDRCLHELFAAQAARTPRAVAAVCGDETVTYGELEARANRLAHCLQQHGVVPEVLVGLCLERSVEMLVALLAILKAGGAYVPLDPKWPAERLALIAADSRLSLVVTNGSASASLPGLAGSHICLDRDAERISRASAGPVSAAVTPENLAYVLHTSGSTGSPKGVQIPHRALVNFLASMQRFPGIRPDDVLLAVTTISFDIAGLELYLPLLAGARVVVARRETAADGRALAARIASSGATVMQATPATWRMLRASGWTGQPALKALSGGEALTGDLARFLLPACGELWNLYGPTETTIWSTMERVASDQARITIGRPIANTHVHVLDRRMAPLPVGQTGEIFIGGEGLARGYLRRPDATAEKFVPDPFAGARGARLYRTGDLGRRLADGRIEFAGRVDDQVKIRGFRIELGEIESVLRQHPAVQDAVAAVRDDASGEKHLAAYFVAPTNPPVSDLRGFLTARLPGQMIPGTFVQLEALPLTPNGKVDRRALPEPNGARAAVRTAIVAPRTPTEKRLVEIWQRQLGVSPISVEDRFFEIGGHSLAAAHVFFRIEKELGRSLSPATLFQAPTIAALGAILDQANWKPDWKCLVAIRPNGTRPPLFCVHGALANVLYCDDLARHLPEELPFYAFQSLGLDGSDEPLATVEEMAEFYLRELRGVQPEGPYYLTGFSLGGLVAIEMARRLLVDGERVGLVALLDTECPVACPHLPPRSWLFQHRLIPWVLHAEQGMLFVRERGWAGYLRRSIALACKKVSTVRQWRHRAAGRGAPPSHLERVTRMNQRAWYRYRPQRYPGRITLLHAAGRHPQRYADPDTRLAWSDYAAEGLEVHLIPGHHTTMRAEPHVRVLAEKLTACLDRAQAQS